MSEHRILLKGRLGNQMFIYAFAHALFLETGVTSVLLDDWMVKHGVQNRLDCFCLAEGVLFGHGKKLGIQRSILNTLSVKILHNTKRVRRHSLELSMNSWLSEYGLYRVIDGYGPLPDKERLASMDFYMEGYFQSERYFRKYRKEVLDAFSFKPSVVSSCQSVAQKILAADESTCLHVRLGDYVNHYLHGVAKADYYKKALRLLRERKPHAQVFLFSDNTDLAKAELGLGSDVSYLPDDCDEQQTMYLGSLCKNFIISNSSFSWWMQYLSRHDDKCIIAPSRWYAMDIPCDLYDADWITIEV